MTLFLGVGLIHLVMPQVFFPAIPDFFIFKTEIIYFTGVLEILLAVGLLCNKTRDLSARFSALYLLCLVPSHVYMALAQKEMLGTSSPLLHWGRTLFQFVLIYLVLSLQRREHKLN